MTIYQGFRKPAEGSLQNGIAFSTRSTLSPAWLYRMEREHSKNSKPHGGIPKIKPTKWHLDFYEFDGILENPKIRSTKWNLCFCRNRPVWQVGSTKWNSCFCQTRGLWEVYSTKWHLDFYEFDGILENPKIRSTKWKLGFVCFQAQKKNTLTEWLEWNIWQKTKLWAIKMAFVCGVNPIHFVVEIHIGIQNIQQTAGTIW